MQYYIVGFPKCGTVSLQYKLGKGTMRYEYVYNPKGLKIYTEKYLSYTHPVFIIRNPVQRIWSAFTYFNQFEKMSFEEFLKKKKVKDYRLGIDDPIEQADYWKYIKNWLHLKPCIVKLESLKKENFPWKNNTKKYRPINDEEKKLLIDKLNEKNILEKYDKIEETGIF